MIIMSLITFHCVFVNITLFIVTEIVVKKVDFVVKCRYAELVIRTLSGNQRSYEVESSLLYSLEQRCE